MIGEDIYVVPINDLRDHTAYRTCWCSPKRDDVEPLVWLHNSMDQREYTKEQGKLQ